MMTVSETTYEKTPYGDKIIIKDLYHEGSKYYNLDILPRKERFTPVIDGLSGAKDLVYKLHLNKALLHNIHGSMLSCVGNRPWEIAEMMSPVITELVAVDWNYFRLKDMVAKVESIKELPPIVVDCCPKKSGYWGGGIVDYAIRSAKKFAHLDFDGKVMGNRWFGRAVATAMENKAILSTWGSKRGRGSGCYFWGVQRLRLAGIKIISKTDIEYGNGQERSIYVLEKA